MNATLKVESPETSLLAELAATALAVERAFDQAAPGSPGLSRTDQRRLLLALELRLKLEDQVLLPAWRDALLRGVDDAAKEIHVLRELAFELIQPHLGQRQRALLIASLDGLATLHFDHVATLAIKSGQHKAFDTQRALAEIRAFQARWREEIGATGSVEDEESDPVGRRPR